MDMFLFFVTISLTLQTLFFEPCFTLERHTSAKAFKDDLLADVAAVNIVFNRTEISPLYETRFLTTEFNLSGNIPSDSSLSIVIDDEKYAVVVSNSSIQLPNNQVFIEGTFTMEGRRLGLGLLSFYLHPNGQVPGDNDSVLLRNNYRVVVLRLETTEEEIFEIGIIVLAVILYIGFGCLIDLSVVWRVLKRPIGPGIGFLCQFVVMPLIGFGLAEALGLDPAFAFGLVTMACAPGGGSSNVWVNLLGGDLDLSLTMTSISTLASLAMMPCWLYLLGTQFIDSSSVDIPYSDIALTLLYIIIPCGVGVAIKKFFPKIAAKAALCIRPFSGIFVAYILIFGTYVNWYMFEVIGDEPLVIPAAFLLPCLGYLCGFLLALILKRSRKVAITIAIETGVQNASIPILVLQRSFPQPEGDLGAIMPLAAAYFYSIPILCVWVGLITYKKCTGQDPIDDGGKEQTGMVVNINEKDNNQELSTVSGVIGVNAQWVDGQKS